MSTLIVCILIARRIPSLGKPSSTKSSSFIDLPKPCSVRTFWNYPSSSLPNHQKEMQIRGEEVKSHWNSCVEIWNGCTVSTFLQKFHDFGSENGVHCSDGASFVMGYRNDSTVSW